jgi:hypothetical protein
VTHAQPSPPRTWNDDSCDISVAPAATLLLPYFEVEFQYPQAWARTTIFSIINTSQLPQIAKITLWTDWAYPALTFSVYMNGHGIASINLYDLFSRGVLLPGPDRRQLQGSLPKSSSNPNHLPGALLDCSGRPTTLSASELNDLQLAFRYGIVNGCQGNHVGGVHQAAIGYATIDVVATCSDTVPSDPTYYATEILFDNVLTGDWELVNPDTIIGNYAGGNPLVHLRAIPEGGPAGSNIATNLPYTFYDRYTTVGGMYARTVDRRQPLASTFAARWIQGGTTGFSTDFIIWREGYTGANAPCRSYSDNQLKEMTEFVRFDEHENTNATLPPIIICTPPPQRLLGALPTTSATATSSDVFPGLSYSGDVAGWMFINASNHGSPAYSTAPGRDFKTDSSTFPACARQNQSWVTIRMTAEGRYSVLFDAVPLGNGCSKSPPPGATIGPAPNVTP